MDKAFNGSRKVCSIPPFSFPVFGKDTYREVTIGEDVDRRLLVGWREAKVRNVSDAGANSNQFAEIISTKT